MTGTTEDINPFTSDIDTWDYEKIVRFIHLSDIEAFEAINSQIEKISRIAEVAVDSIKKGGRVIYVGAGTSGRIAAQDVVELRPTYGLGKDAFDYVMAGGDKALTESLEGSEDNVEDAVLVLKSRELTSSDLVVGISASGTTPFVISSLKYASEIGCTVVGITSNPGKPISEISDICIEIFTGPEVIQGSTRMKAGTAQKMVLNMVSTAVAIKLGRTYKNTMSNMGSWYNEKLKNRAINILVQQFGVPMDEATKILDHVNYDISAAISIVKSKR